MSHRHQPSVRLAAEISRLTQLAEPGLLLDRSGIILFVNQAWDRFAHANGGDDLVSSRGLVGTSWLDQIAGEEPRRYHRLLLQRAARRLGSRHGRSVVQLNESNTPALARLVATELTPLAEPGGGLAYLAVVHRTVRERPLADVYPPVDGPADRWRGDHGVVQCSCCRRVARPEAPAEWDLSIALLEHPAATTRFDYCPLCLELHYPGGAGVEAAEDAEPAAAAQAHVHAQ